MYTLVVLSHVHHHQLQRFAMLPVAQRCSCVLSPCFRQILIGPILWLTPRTCLAHESSDHFNLVNVFRQARCLHIISAIDIIKFYLSDIFRPWHFHCSRFCLLSCSAHTFALNQRAHPAHYIHCRCFRNKIECKTGQFTCSLYIYGLRCDKNTKRYRMKYVKCMSYVSTGCWHQSWQVHGWCSTGVWTGTQTRSVGKEILAKLLNRSV